MNRYIDYFSKFFRDKKGRVVVWQAPNIPLLGWVIFTILAHILPLGNWRLFAGYVSFGFIFTWSWLELSQGASYFRRVVGVVVLIATIHSKLI